MALGQNGNVRANPPGTCSVYVDNIFITKIAGDFPDNTPITITSTGISQTGYSVYTASAEISGMEIATGSNPDYVGTVINVGETVGGSNSTYSISQIGSGGSGMVIARELYLTPVYAPTGPRTIFLSVTNGTVTEFSHELTPDTGYTLPSSVTVTGASSSYSDGIVTLTNLTSSVSETAEASQGGSGSLTVTYNSSDIIDTTSDGTYILPCSGKIMNSDIVISAENVTSLTVTYNNTNIINASNDTHTYTLSCNGKYMSSDIGISVTIGGSSVVLHEQEGSTVYLYGAYTKTQSDSVVTIT